MDCAAILAEPGVIEHSSELVHDRFEVVARDPRRLGPTLDRTLTLDRHARYLTTRALVLESLGRDVEAREAHEAAVAALPVREYDGRIRIIPDDASLHDNRTAHAYGAFLARHGELGAALPWLERGIEVDDAFDPDPRRALRLGALAVVCFRLGDHEHARARAEEALALDPTEASALAVLARLR